MNQSIKILAPASVANLVCGFDVLGMSLEDPADEMTMRLCEKPGVHIEHDDEYNLPLEPEKNVAGAALLAMLEKLDPSTGFSVTVKKNIKPGSGLGSSAASAAGAVAGANALLGNKFSDDDLVRFAMSGEKVASGVKHADNIIVLEKGEVVEMGTHKELIDIEGSYFNLIKNQLELGA